MPAIGHKATFQIQRCHCGKKFPEIRMQRWLAASEHHLLNTHRVARVPGYASEELNGQKVCGTVVKSVFVTKTVAAV